MNIPLPFSHTLPTDQRCTACRKYLRYLGEWRSSDGSYFNNTTYCYSCGAYHFADRDGLAADPLEVELVEIAA